MLIRLSLFVAFTLSACMSTDDDPVYRQADWMRTEDYKACKAEEDKALAEYEAAKSAYEKAQSNYDYDSELKKFEREMAEFEEGKRKLMPLRPSVIGPAGIGPKLPKVGQCSRPPEGWMQE